MFWDIFVELCNSIDKALNNVVSELGLASGTATKWKKGTKPHDSTCKKIADYFGVTVEYLKGETDIKNPTADDDSGKEKELIRLFKSIPDERRNEAMNYLRYLADQKTGE